MLPRFTVSAYTVVLSSPFLASMACLKLVSVFWFSSVNSSNVVASKPPFASSSSVMVPMMAVYRVP